MKERTKMPIKTLPIGTVVQLVDVKEKVMICGRQQINEEDGLTYDYSGCPFNAVRKAAQADEAKQIATGAVKDVIKKVTEGAANNVMDEYVATPGNAGMPNAVKRESRDNLILSY